MTGTRVNAPVPILTFVGHISVDKIENANGCRTQPGGGALYGAYAAKTLNLKTAIVSAIGKDFPFPKCFVGLDSTCIKAFKLPTTKFHISYNQSWDAKYKGFELGAGARIAPSHVSPRLLQARSAFHISPMKPAKAAKFVTMIRERSSESKLSMSTWIGYVNQPRGRRLLRKLAAQVDFFMLNEFEAKALAQTSSLSSALESIRAPTLIVTMGKLGAVVGGTERDPQMVPALNVPVDKVVDTTGAGDTWNGAFLGAYLKTGDLMRSVTAASIVSSIKCSRWGFDALRKLSFHKPSDVVEYVLALREGSMQKKISDFG